MAPDRAPQPPERADFYAAAVYGSIVAAALLAAFRKEHNAAATVLLALLASLLVFWLGHVWSTIVGERAQHGADFRAARIVEIARAEWPLVEAAFVPCIALLLGWVGALSRDVAIECALGLAVAQLFAWGYVVGSRAYDHRWQAVATAVVDGMLGFAIVALELLIVH